MQKLTHFDDKGASRMVDVSTKAVTHRVAVARAKVLMKPATLQRIMEQSMAKGNVLEVARLAGIMAAKRTDELIPLCHPLQIESVGIDYPRAEDGRLEINAEVHVTAKTGAEMEALTACAVCALTVYDMCKAIDRGMEITDLHLVRKSGGQSGDIVLRPEETEDG